MQLSLLWFAAYREGSKDECGVRKPHPVFVQLIKDVWRYTQASAEFDHSS